MEEEIIESCGNVFADMGLPDADKRLAQADMCISGQSHLPNGCTLYWELNQMGNRVYSSDEIGGGVHVWDVTLVDQGTLLAALTKELELQMFERHQKELKLRRIANDVHAAFALCTCLTKTPDPAFHEKNCAYRLKKEEG